ncbi:MAG: hypothetical protein K0B87_09360, partial [Candidatus Syntrophosphaera sp.]|nr:hypothetical protein [Candidatus Syntrophosphaera sp.]
MYPIFNPTLLMGKADNAAPALNPEAEFIILDPDSRDRAKPAPRPDLSFADGGERSNSAIKYPVTIGKKVTAPSVIAIRDIAHVIESIKTGFVEGTDLRALIHTIRNQPNQDLAKAMKTGLPWFCGAVCERFRSNATVQSAQFMLFDLDHVPDIEGMKAAAIAKLPFVRYAFRSVRDGVKLIAQLDRPITVEEEFRTLWRYLALRVMTTLDHPVDSAPDWARACFFSFDPGLLHNSGFRPLEVEKAGLEAKLLYMMAACAEEDHAGVERGTSMDSSNNGVAEVYPGVHACRN